MQNEFNILIDPLPTCVWVGNEAVPVNCGFRTMIGIELLIYDHDVPEEDKKAKELALFYGMNLPAARVNEAYNQLLWFHRCGAEEKESGIEKRIFDFRQDACLIYSAFLVDYGIDLQEDPDMHWWKFMALFTELSSGKSFFAKVMQYRYMKVPAKASPEQKAFIAKMKSDYAIEEDKPPVNNALTQALMAGDAKAVEEALKGGT